ncbi:hypothetical protein BG011_008688 [Mortierella polycephala]|uniref:Uncharacterized protein n=1 Tax=Mortierella polycephala TaxID=41804 RepID=A0A9P6QBB9_9FUNG|nr:hypothetical protein BG011_008688 [Mortierella polycephala]
MYIIDRSGYSPKGAISVIPVIEMHMTTPIPSGSEQTTGIQPNGNFVGESKPESQHLGGMGPSGKEKLKHGDSSQL